jgi:CHAD domain-containing protein
MASYKKFKYKDLSAKSTLSKTARVVLLARLKNLNSSIKKYFNEDSEKNLHGVRISIRRVRYNMEVFAICFDKKNFMFIYEMIEKLQDLTGMVRDIDVLIINLNSLISEENIPVPDELISKFAEKRILLKEELTLELMKLSHSENLKEFMKLLI